MNHHTTKKLTAAIILAAVSTIQAGTSKNTSGPVQNGQSDGGSGNPSNNNPAVTISQSGGTQLRGFNTSQGISELSPGTSITFHGGTSGAAIQYIAPGTAGTFVQLANPDFTSSDVNPGTPASPSTSTIQLHSAVRLEWKDQGSIDGLIDLINDQVGFLQVSQGGSGPISSLTGRAPSVSNPVWINTNKFTATGTINGLSLASGASNLANTYDATLYNQTTGANLQGGQNRIQFSTGEFQTEDLSVNGTPDPFRGPGIGGYGKGNPALLAASGNISGLGVKGTRQQFQSNTVANQSTDKIDPNTGANYPKGPWNTAGANNLSTQEVAVAALGFVANPGTGLYRVNKGDSQWLQLTGRLQNGALFNVAQRNAGAGQRVVGAASYGIDPSWAIGTSDDGDSTTTANANAQHSIGPSLRFSGKTSDAELQKTVAQNRLSVAADLSLAQIRSSASNAPIRALDVYFNGTTDPLSGGVTDTSKFVRISFDSLVSSNANTRYQAVVTSHYVTVKSPSLTALNSELIHEGLPSVGTFSDFQTDASGNVFTNTLTAAQLQNAWAQVSTFDPASAQNSAPPAGASVSVIKGDPNRDVAAFLSNIVNSLGSAAAGLTSTTVNNPADSLFLNNFNVPGLLNWKRQATFDAITPVTLSSAALAEQQDVKNNFGTVFSADSTAGANAQTIGNSAFYGAGNSGGAAINGTIPITAKDASGNTVGNGTIAPKGNYLFGNFNQNGVRDYSAVLESVNAALSLHHVDGALNSIFTPDGGVVNNTVISALSGSPGWSTTANTKGDLIVLGDFNGDGKFDGKDVYLLAKGSALADSASSTTLTATPSTFGDVVRDPNKVLRKNSALDAINTQLNNSGNADQSFVRQTARAVLTGVSVPSGATDLGTNTDGSHNYTFDPNGVNAFNKFDVNRDGKVDRLDGQIVDYFIGKDYHNLSDTLGAVVRTDFNAGGTAFVDASGAPLDPTAAANASIPRRQISLVDVELNDTGDITRSGDFNLIRSALGTTVLRDGDANFDGVVNTIDFNVLAGNFNASANKWSQADFNGDGIVNALDFNALATDFGQTSPALALGSLVPEPSLGTVLFAACGLALGESRKKKSI